MNLITTTVSSGNKRKRGGENPQNFVAPSPNQDTWLISKKESVALVTELLNTVLHEKKEINVLVPGVGLDDSCLFFALNPKVKSVLLIDVDEKSRKFFWARKKILETCKPQSDEQLETLLKNYQTALTHEDLKYPNDTKEFTVGEKVTFIFNQQGDSEPVPEHQKFDLILDKSFFDVMVNLKIVSSLWGKFVKPLKKGGVCVILSMMTAKLQTNLKKEFNIEEQAVYFSVLYSNNMKTDTTRSGRHVKRLALASLALVCNNKYTETQHQKVFDFQKNLIDHKAFRGPNGTQQEAFLSEKNEKMGFQWIQKQHQSFYTGIGWPHILDRNMV